VEPEPTGLGHGRRLRLALAAEHLDRSHVEGDDDSLREAVSDCVDPKGMYDTYKRTAAALDAWHEGGRRGERPPGRLRRMQPPELGVVARALALPPYLAVHDPDGRPRPLRKQGGF